MDGLCCLRAANSARLFAARVFPGNDGNRLSKAGPVKGNHVDDRLLIGVDLLDGLYRFVHLPGPAGDLHLQLRFGTDLADVPQIRGRPL